MPTSLPSRSTVIALNCAHAPRSLLEVHKPLLTVHNSKMCSQHGLTIIPSRIAEHTLAVSIRRSTLNPSLRLWSPTRTQTVLNEGNSSSDLAEKMGNTIAIIIPVLSALIEVFARKPMNTNDTMRAIQASTKQIEEQKRRLDELEARAKELARVAHEREAAAREREKAALTVARLREETAISTAREFKAAAEKARKQEAGAKSLEEAALAEAKKAQNALQRGIRPVVMPTEAQVQAAMKRIQYDPEKLHFAVCGTSGSGKSSLINAFRGLGRREGSAAAVGVTETTAKVTRYPDPRSVRPYSRFVWFDIPGAGTTAVSDWQYFNDQGLFVFDFIVMVYDVRFTKIDVGIIENCYRFDIPVFIVRSKADQHIDNMMKEEEIDSTLGDADSPQIYQEMKSKYVDATKSDFDKHMEAMAESPEVDERDRQLILNQRVYIVSGANVRGLLQTGAKKGRGVDRSRITDEVLLLEDMLRAAARRRYSKPEWKGLFRKGREAISAGLCSLLLGSEAPHSSNSGA